MIAITAASVGSTSSPVFTELPARVAAASASAPSRETTVARSQSPKLMLWPNLLEEEHTDTGRRSAGKARASRPVRG